MSKFITLVPAYGRDYNSAKAVKADWKGGKDFLIQSVGHPSNGRYVNNNDLPAGMILTIRYKKLTQVCVIKT